jgi:hypothetical protein
MISLQGLGTNVNSHLIKGPTLGPKFSLAAPKFCQLASLDSALGNALSLGDLAEIQAPFSTSRLLESILCTAVEPPQSTGPHTAFATIFICTDSLPHLILAEAAMADVPLQCSRSTPYALGVASNIRQ